MIALLNSMHGTYECLGMGTSPCLQLVSCFSVVESSELRSVDSELALTVSIVLVVR